MLEELLGRNVCMVMYLRSQGAIYVEISIILRFCIDNLFDCHRSQAVVFILQNIVIMYLIKKQSGFNTLLPPPGLL
jgi:hypothetical protein